MHSSEATYAYSRSEAQRSRKGYLRLKLCFLGYTLYTLIDNHKSQGAFRPHAQYLKSYIRERQTRQQLQFSNIRENKPGKSKETML